MISTLGTIGILVTFFLVFSLRVLKENERGVLFRLGRFIDQVGPGLIILIPMVDHMVRVSLGTTAMDIPPQDIITRDNVSAKVSAVVHFQVVDPTRAVVEVENYQNAISELAQTTVRSVCGQSELDDLLSKRDKIDLELQQILDRETDSWGVKVSSVEVKHIDLPA
jgi:regulator of protease activity HflC (stomatin/prohibitin superfamily)